jgi:hypothetical protein
MFCRGRVYPAYIENTAATRPSRCSSLLRLQIMNLCPMIAGQCFFFLSLRLWQQMVMQYQTAWCQSHVTCGLTELEFMIAAVDASMEM